jgi:hypothetical protein
VSLVLDGGGYSECLVLHSQSSLNVLTDYRFRHYRPVGSCISRSEYISVDDVYKPNWTHFKPQDVHLQISYFVSHIRCTALFVVTDHDLLIFYITIFNFRALIVHMSVYFLLLAKTPLLKIRACM